jgi:cytochrome c oxidase subunit 2
MDQSTSVFNAHSAQARAIADLFIFDLVIAALIFLTVASLIVYVVIRFRRRPGAPEPYQDPGNPKLEVVWTVVPALILLALLVGTGWTMLEVNPPPSLKPPDAVVTAHQWWWEYRYPKSGVVTANELHMVENENWLLRIESADVIHDFWVPDLGSKKDAIPGHPNYLWIQPHRAGKYQGACAEYCGADHSMMRILVIVESPEKFAAWTESQLRVPGPPAGEAAIRGSRLFEAHTCVNCHTVAGTEARGKVGPDLTHVADRETLGSGMVSNTPENLARWIKNPQQVKPGCQMPDLRLSESQALDIAAYLEGLK